MYISIPEGMIYKQITKTEKDKLGNTVTEARDCFVHKENDQIIIDLQALVKEALRLNTKGNKCIKLTAFTIYLNTPPKSTDEFLKYTPNENGKYACKIEPEIVKGEQAQKFDPKLLSSNGNFWYQQRPEGLDADLRERRLSQKENRRHYGNSPLGT